MAFTTAQLESLEAAIASGNLIVRYGDKSVQYQSLDAMMRLRDRMRAELGITNVSGKKFYSRFNKGLDE